MTIQAGNETLSVWAITDGQRGVNGVMCDTVTITAGGAPTTEQVLALLGGLITGADGRTYEGYTGMAETTLTLFRPPETAQELEVQRLTREAEAARQRTLAAEKLAEKTAREKQAAIAQKEAAEQDKAAIAGAIPTLLKGRNDDSLAEWLQYLPEWTQKAWTAGEVCRYSGQPYRCVKDHDATDNGDWNPKDATSLWAIYHAKSAAWALDWAQPTGAHDAYMAGEWMALGGVKWECLTDGTAHAPSDAPDAWRQEGEGQGEAPESGGESEAPSAWVQPQGTVGLYQTGDRVTHGGKVWQSTVDNNSWEPGVYGWEEVTA